MKQYSLRPLILLSLPALFFSRSLWAQTTLPDINPPEVAATTDVSLTPNVTGSNAGIGNIYSPNLFDGSANIVVPIYQYQNDYGNYGVSFSYNTKGVKVDEIASTIGLHWQLNAGGGITRVMKDVPDEADDYIGIYTPGQGPAAFIKGKWAGILGATSPQEYTANDSTIYRDGEFDDFIVSAGSLNFTFNLGKDGFVFTHPNRRVKMELLVNDVPVTQLPYMHYSGVDSYINVGFHITDEQGTQYWFRKDNVAEWDLWDGRMVTSAIVKGVQYNAHWVLSKITFANGQSIRYNYDRVNVSNTLYSNSVALETAGGGYTNSYSEAVATDSISELSSISYPNGVTVNFIYGSGRCDAGDRILSSIQVTAGDKSINYVMQQQYATARHANCSPPAEIALGNCNISTIYGCTGGVSPDAQRYLRLRLKGITIRNDDGSYSEPYYTFSYDTTQLPARLTASQDYFGYYNGVAIANSADEEKSVPRHTPIIGTGGTYGILRSYNAAKAKAGLLTKITNAYGGSDSFQYGNHLLFAVSGMPAPANDALFMGNEPDGVCLISVIETDPYYTGNYKRTNFTYSGGQYFIPGGYFNIPRSVGSGSTADAWYFTGIYVSPHEPVNGSNHGYSSVTVATQDQNSNLLGEKVITFTNLSDATSNSAPRYYLAGDAKNYYQYPFANRQYLKDWELGLPLETRTYDQNNRIVSDVINTYTFSAIDNSSANKVENKKIMRFPNSSKLSAGAWYRRYYNYDSAAYHPYTGTAQLSSTITRKYVSDNSYVADTVSYTFDSHHNLLTTTASNSLGEKTVLRNVYNYSVCGPDVLPETPPQTNAALYSMSQAGLEKVVSMERWKTVDGGGVSDKLLDASITQYQYQNGHLYTKGLYTYQTGSPVIRSTYQGFANPTSALNNPYHNVINAYNSSAAPASYYQETSKVTSFDAKGNPLETQLLGMNQYKAMLWDTLNGNKIAEAANARAGEIACAGFEPIYNGVNYVETSTITSGNLTYNPMSIVAAGSVPGGTIINGTRAYKLQGATPLWSQLFFNVVNGGKAYTVSFWSKNGLPVFSGNLGTTVTFSNTYSAPNGWKFYEGKFSPLSGEKMSFTTTATLYLDDVRICPANALMQSWTYEPLFGKSSATDPRGRITWYEYDALGRPTIVRDQEGNIKKYTISRVTN